MKAFLRNLMLVTLFLVPAFGQTTATPAQTAVDSSGQRRLGSRTSGCRRSRLKRQRILARAIPCFEPWAVWDWYYF